MEDKTNSKGRELGVGSPFDVKWAKETAGESAKAVYLSVCNIVLDSVAWYQTMKPANRNRAKMIRIWVIVLGAISACIPTLVDLSADWGKDAEYQIPASVTTIFFAITGALLVIDRFFGYSSSWIRYTMTGLQLRQALQSFRLEWEVIMVGWIDKEPSAEQAIEAIGQCKNFLTKCNNLILEETTTWKTDFEKALKEIDDSAKTAPVVQSTGAINLKITNGADCKGGWTISVDGGTFEDGNGNMAARRNLVPGIHVIRVEGKMAETTSGGTPGRIVRAEIVFSIAAATVTTESVTLE
jgi:hypothetical protein